MERNIKERVSQYVDENKVKEKLTQFFQEKIVNRKAMFIPITGVATFMLVGYAAADTKAPEITSDQIEVPYGEKSYLHKACGAKRFDAFQTIQYFCRKIQTFKISLK